MFDNFFFTHFVFVVVAILLAFELLKLSERPVDIFYRVFLFTTMVLFCGANCANFFLFTGLNHIIFFYSSSVFFYLVLFFGLMLRSLYLANPDLGEKYAFPVIFRQFIHVLFVFFMSIFLLYHVVLLKYINLILFPDNVAYAFLYHLDNFYSPFLASLPFSEHFTSGFTAGEVYLVYVCCITWGYDSFAYFFGVFWGKKKLPFAISPQKSYAGLMGGAFSTSLLVAGSFLLQDFLQNNFQGYRKYMDILPLFEDFGVFLMVSFLLIGVAQIGDLFASFLKRVKGVKDSGMLFPGHGGLLDRIDSFIFVVPTLFYLVLLGYSLGF